MEPEEKEKTFYILFFFKKAKDTEIDFKFPSKKTEKIDFLKESLKDGKRYIFILKHTQENPSKMVNLFLKNNEEIFRVSFSANEGTFIFIPTLTIKKNTISNEKVFSQKQALKMTDKIEYFLKNIDKKIKVKLETLYSDCVDFLSVNQDYELLIYLFIKLIEYKLKDMCKKLLNIFWEKTTNDKIEQLNSQTESGKQYLEKMKNIASNSEKYDKDYDKAKFYGLILFYLNTNDYKQFQTLSKKLQEQNESQNFFFDILVHYSTTFSFPNYDKAYLVQYVNYVSGKDFETLEKSGFSYFKKIEEFIHVIYKSKEKFFKMNSFKTLKIPKGLDYKLEKPEIVIDELNQIIDSSQQKKQLLIFLSGAFWKEMTEVFGKYSVKNIANLFQLRKTFKKYLKFVKETYKPEHVFCKNAEETDERDQIAVTLNKIIQKNIEQETDINNDEIINQITKYNIYYIEDIYASRRDLGFLDKIDFDEKEIEWKSSFKNCNFEDIFNTDIDKYLVKLYSKIKKMEDFDTFIALINEDKIKKLGKMEYLIKLLRKKVLYLMKSCDLWKEANKTNEKISALTKLIEIIYKYYQNLDNKEDIFEKIRDIIIKLDNKNKNLVFMKLLKSFKEDNKLQQWIFDFYINDINSFYIYISPLFEFLEEEKIKELMKKISDKKEDKKNIAIISYEDFFTENENLSLNLLKELTKNINKIIKTYYYGENKKVLDKVYKSIFEKKTLKIKYLKILLSFPKENVIGRFNLLNILNKHINPEDNYEELKKNYEKAKEEIKELNNFSTALKCFHKNFNKNEINKIDELIEKFDDETINIFDNVSKLRYELGDDIKIKVEKINQVKGISIFKNLF